MICSRSWLGPYDLPTFGQTGLAARTDYVVLSPTSVLLFITANKQNGEEGKVCCVRSDDGCKTWALQSFVDGDAETVDEQIMPASLLLPDGSLLVATRCCGDGHGGRSPTRQWIDIYRSKDEGRSFQHIARPIDQASRAHGNPPTLSLLPDGTICMVYGYREQPYGLRYVLSDLLTGGAQWGEEHVLRDDGGCSDLGYVRANGRDDGKVLAAYYYNDDAEGDRYIASTIFTPSGHTGPRL